MKSRLTPTRLRSSELGSSEGVASEADFRAGLTGRYLPGSSHDPYNGVSPESARHAKRTDLRELSRLIQLRREKDLKKRPR